ncbi:MAG: hypothetical protein ABI648_09170 [Betaproteobacteria bacterium]
MSQEFERFGAYLKIADMIIEQATTKDLAGTARVLALHLALHLAHYRAAHGEIPLSKSFDLLLTETPMGDQAGELADGFAQPDRLHLELSGVPPIRN